MDARIVNLGNVKGIEVDLSKNGKSIFEAMAELLDNESNNEQNTKDKTGYNIFVDNMLSLSKIINEMGVEPKEAIDRIFEGYVSAEDF